MKLISFNINSVRARLHQLSAIIESHQPDVIGLQETKVDDGQFPRQEIEYLGYQVVFHGQKSHYGVALLTKASLQSSFKGFPTDADDAQRRLVGGTLELPNGESLTVINGYFPQGENRDHESKFPAKKKFYEDLQVLLESQYAANQNVAVMGDFNISPTDMDIGIGEPNRKRWLRDGKCSFLPEEREWFERLLGWGLHDSYRLLYPEVDDLYSWFDYRSKGFDREPKRGLRIDTVLVSDNLRDKVGAAGIDYEARAMEKPSDHCPVWVELKV